MGISRVRYVPTSAVVVVGAVGEMQIRVGVVEPASDSVGIVVSPSPVWLKTTSSHTSISREWPNWTTTRARPAHRHPMRTVGGRAQTIMYPQ